MNTDTISELLGIEPTIEAEVVSTALVPAANTPATLTTTEASDVSSLNSDVEFARQKVKDLIAVGRDAFDSAVLLAKSGDSPRAYEVVAGMLTALVDANRKLIDIHKGKIDGTPESTTPTATPVEGSGTVNIEKAVFVGRAQDLLREIRAMVEPKTE